MMMISYREGSKSYDRNYNVEIVDRPLCTQIIEAHRKLWLFWNKQWQWLELKSDLLLCKLKHTLKLSMVDERKFFRPTLVLGSSEGEFIEYWITLCPSAHLSATPCILAFGNHLWDRSIPFLTVPPFGLASMNFPVALKFRLDFQDLHILWMVPMFVNKNGITIYFQNPEMKKYPAWYLISHEGCTDKKKWNGPLGPLEPCI